MNPISFSARKYFFALTVLANVSLMFAQNSDLGLWTTIDIESSMSPKWDIGLSGEYRWKNNISVTDQIRGGVTVTRNLGNYFNLGAGYILIADKKANRDIFELRNRFLMQARGQYKYARFTADWRVRMQLTLLEKNDENTSAFDSENTNWVLRNRFRLRYNIKGSSFRPYAHFEMFHQLFSNLEYRYFQNRLSVGTVYRMNRSHDFAAGYMLENATEGTQKFRRNIIQVGYTFSF